jgi:uncharacterized protein YacL
MQTVGGKPGRRPRPRGGPATSEFSVMILLLLRGLFVFMAAMIAALYSVSLLQSEQLTTFGQVVVATIAAMGASLAIVAADLMTGRKKLAALSGVFLGLIVGLLAAYALSFIVAYIGVLFPGISDILLQGVNVFIGLVCIYACVSLVLQTKDDFRFVIPYVEFAKEYRGTRPMVLDTSAIIDGRILDIAATQIVQGLLIVPRFVLNELQTISDSADKLKRARGRRGLDIVAKLQNNPAVDVAIEDAPAEGATVDQKLLSLAQDLHARILTTDFNLTKVAQLRGVEVVNVNQLAEALRPVVLPGEAMSVRIVKPGEGAGQGVGYLEDGTMVVVEQARDKIGQEIALTVSSSLQTSAGKMIFGRLAPSGAGPAEPDADRGSAGSN